MPTYNGVLIDSSFGPTQDPNITWSLEYIDFTSTIYSYSEITPPTGGTYSRTPASLITFPENSLSGNLILAYFDDLYNRVHLIPNEFNFGSLLAIDTKYFQIWNAFVDQGAVLNAITGPSIAQSGVSIVTDPLPKLFYPLEVQQYSITADVVGPPSIDFTFTFDFLGLYDIDINTYGIRISIWGEMPQRGWQEVYEWKTDEITTYSGKKQFIALRDQPRLELIHKYSVSDLDNTERGRILNKLRTTISNNYAVPIWSQFKILQQDTLVDTTTIYIDTSKMDIEVGSFLLLWTNDNNYEAVAVNTINANDVLIEKGVTQTYLKGALCVPLILCFLPKTLEHRLYPLSKTDYDIKFKAKKGVDIQSGNLPKTYDNGTYNLDFMDEQSILISTSTKNTVHTANRIEHDNDTGIHRIDYVFPYAISMNSITKRFHSRDDVWNFRAWLQKMKGKQGLFWVPEYEDTISVVGFIPFTSSIVKIKDIDLKYYFENTPFASELYFIFKNGNTYHRRIISIDQNGSEQDITLNSTIGVDFTMDDISRIALLHRVGITSDTFTFNYNYDGLCEISFNVEEMLQ